MPPKTRSQTSRSRPANPPSLHTLDEELRNLNLGGDRTESPSPVQPSSPEYDSGAERQEADGIENRTTPKIRKKTRTVASSQRNLARDADPNEGRCLLTNRSAAIQLCHLVAQATDRETLTKLEYVWELGYQRFNVDTRHNMLYLRSDWHILFDQSQWILVPEINFIEELKKIYLDDMCRTCKIQEQFTEPTYQYYIVPTPTLQEAICRFPVVNCNDRHDVYLPPFSSLGPLTSHVHPYYVIFNTGQKLSNSFKRREVMEMHHFLSQNLSITVEGAMSVLASIEDLYTAWMEMKLPANWLKYHVPSNPPHPPGGEGHNDPSQGDHPNRQGLRSVTRSRGQGRQASAGRYDGGHQRAVLPFHASEAGDSSSVTDDTVVEDDTHWIEYIHNWKKQGESSIGIADMRESDVLNNSRDKQLATYINEHARTPPSPGVWGSWKPTWDNYPSSYPSLSDRSQFSSNDWAVFKNDVYLTRLEHPQATL